MATKCHWVLKRSNRLRFSQHSILNKNLPEYYKYKAKSHITQYNVSHYHYTINCIYYNSVLCRICLYPFNSNVNFALFDIPDDCVTFQPIKIVSSKFANLLGHDFVQKIECHKLYKSHSFKMNLSNMSNL